MFNPPVHKYSNTDSEYVNSVILSMLPCWCHTARSTSVPKHRLTVLLVCMLTLTINWNSGIIPIFFTTSCTYKICVFEFDTYFASVSVLSLRNIQFKVIFITETVLFFCLQHSLPTDRDVRLVSTTTEHWAHLNGVWYTTNRNMNYLYFQQCLLIFCDAVFFLQQTVPPQEGLQGCGLPWGHLAFGGELGFWKGRGRK